MSRATMPARPLVGRRARLVPPSRALVDSLYRLASADEIPWPWMGAMTPANFDESLWSGVLAQYAIEDVRTGDQVGLLRADGANLFHGYAYVSMFLLPEFQMKGWPLEGLKLFGGFLYKKFNLQHLYAEAAEKHIGQYRSGMGTYFEIEARFADRIVVDGERQTQYVLSFIRDRFYD